MSGISEVFKDQKIQELLEDYIAFEKNFDNVSSRTLELLQTIEQRVDDSFLKGSKELKNELDQTVKALERVITDADNKSLQRIEKISQLVGSIESEGGDYIKKLHDAISDEKRSIAEESGRAKESFYKEAREIIKTFNSDIKTKQSNPTSNNGKVIFAAWLSSIALAVILATGVWFALQEQKKQEVFFYAQGYELMKNIAEDAIDQLPKDKKRTMRKKLEALSR